MVEFVIGPLMIRSVAAVPFATLTVTLVIPDRIKNPLLMTAAVLLALMMRLGVVVRPIHQSNALPLIVPPVIVIVLATVPPCPACPVKFSVPPLIAMLDTN